MKELHREVRRHAHDDRLLDLCGGLHGAIARLDDLLARYAPPDAHGPGAASAEFVDAMLGVIAIRNRLASAFDSAPVAAASAADDGAVAPLPLSESLLR